MEVQLQIQLTALSQLRGPTAESLRSWTETQVRNTILYSFSKKAFPGEVNKSLFNAVVGLAVSTSLLLLGLICAIIYICKIRSKKAEAKKRIKKDANPLYCVDYEEGGEARQDSKREDYDYMGD